MRRKWVSITMINKGVIMDTVIDQNIRLEADHKDQTVDGHAWILRRACLCFGCIQPCLSVKFTGLSTANRNGIKAGRRQIIAVMIVMIIELLMESLDTS
jgi:hypothetical protein